MSREADVPVAVYDCMVFLQGAARATGPAAACLMAAESGKVVLSLSPRILAELRDVLTRPKLQSKFPILTAEYVEAFLSALLRYATVLPEPVPVLACARDPKDAPYINLALAAGAQFLVSRDNDLLDMMDENTADGADLRQRAPGLTILDPARFLQALAPLPEQAHR